MANLLEVDTGAGLLGSRRTSGPGVEENGPRVNYTHA